MALIPAPSDRFSPVASASIAHPRFAAIFCVLAFGFILPAIAAPFIRPYLGDLWPVDPDPDTDWPSLLSLYALYAIAGLAVILGLRWQHQSWRDIGLHVAGGRTLARVMALSIALAAAWALFFVVVFGLGVGVVLWRAGFEPEALEIWQTTHMTFKGGLLAAHWALSKTGVTADFALVVLLSAIVGPLVEEAGFRGIAYGWLRTRAGALVAVSFSAAAFVIYQATMQGYALPSTLLHVVFAIVLALCYSRFKSLWPCIAMRAAQNLLTLLIAFDWTAYGSRTVAS